ncbi:MAG: GNAT family N-acetyltransferase [Zymomonas mobilis subsp. pomaceae]|uniref:GCN5-related N-acetyltransferase n=1 Tax=Zymomonas mobilis subsp. pomaceae (strain ATCC 29192 / DSM 22645 / JCM 10191 / CCUG 17912 / NBRC 13757 / NCIMB 11200 / NRRL B-4491 / Barker I) TaxID=579138 RepID=F8EUZ2_ZYMMT|nr:GNAT family N-acetyltransferase [Zymomonas mobilis]AEI37280.1 GCN5-related N-acetyltransferase [Zymomonas mobilis subsp. pomaceae ATCC 29192]MDX5948649.1 GNAT family N-acetyltransferase [Zymomonas mobilis subsp. pomaceae]GEB88454.1 N-acetyltransferase [Zymomonas mobilis subsp. pomaceae]
MIIRDATAADEQAWRHLWAGYTAFYKTDLSEEITAMTWARVLDPNSSMTIRIAECKDQIIGFVLYVIHEGSWVLNPICYLEDLFVDPAARKTGVGRALIKDIIQLASKHHWSRVYWHTEVDNSARKLYNQFISADNFVRYLIKIN